MNTGHCSKRMVWKWMSVISFDLLVNSYRVVISFPPVKTGGLEFGI